MPYTQYTASPFLWQERIKKRRITNQTKAERKITVAGSREEAILNFLDEVDRLNMHGMLLTLEGQTLAEGYWKPWRAEQPHRMYSVSKSVVSLAVGMLADEGRLSLDDRIAAYFQEWTGGDKPELLLRVTIRDMLRMATCYDRAMYSPLKDEDWTKPFFFGRPTHVPGTVFSYDTSASQVMCALVERLCGKPILDWMEEKLFQPLGMKGAKKWLRDRAGVSQGGTGLIMTLRDLSRLANFCMSDGRGLISSDYLRAATGWQIATDERAGLEERYGYGYQFWQMRRGFSMYGMGGQMAMCLPEKQLCLCTTADLIMDATGVQPLYDAFFRHLADIDTLSSDPALAPRVQARLNALEAPARRNETQNHPFLADIELSHGTLPFDRLEVRKHEVTFHQGGTAYVLPYGNGCWKSGTFPGTEEACISSGGWAAPERFLLHCELNGDSSCGMDLIVALHEREATVRVVSSLWEVVPNWQGQDWGKAAVG